MEAESKVALRRLGEVLLAEGSITEDQLAAAVEEQERTGKRLGEILLARRSVSRLELGNAITEQHADGRRPQASQAAKPPPALDLSDRVAELEARLARLGVATDELGTRLAALEALIPAISDALR